jgi:predicted protein tyrosine phosphatase
MEREHKKRLSARFQPHLADKRVICLDIPDNFRFMDPALVSLLKSKVTKFLPHAPGRIGR